MTKEEQKEYNKKYYQEHKEEKKEYNKQYSQEHKEYYKEYRRQYYLKNRDKELEQSKQYNQEHKEERKEYQKQYQQTPMGRASYLLSAYNRSDNEAGRGKGDLTAQWIVDNIFTQPCHYCDKAGWDNIGCDRMDSSKPHTMDNVVPCCFECNCKKYTKSYDEFINEIKNGE